MNAPSFHQTQNHEQQWLRPHPALFFCAAPVLWNTVSSFSCIWFYSLPYHNPHPDPPVPGAHGRGRSTCKGQVSTKDERWVVWIGGKPASDSLLDSQWWGPDTRAPTPAVPPHHRFLTAAGEGGYHPLHGFQHLRNRLGGGGRLKTNIR